MREDSRLTVLDANARPDGGAAVAIRGKKGKKNRSTADIGCSITLRHRRFRAFLEAVQAIRRDGQAPRVRPRNHAGTGMMANDLESIRFEGRLREPPNSVTPSSRIVFSPSSFFSPFFFFLSLAITEIVAADTGGNRREVQQGNPPTISHSSPRVLAVSK